LEDELNKKEFDFFDKKENIKKLKIWFYILLIILVLLDLVIHKHPHYAWENLFGSYAIYGFLSCVVIVIISKLLGKLLLQKPEDYYDR
jgi:NADH:ubiquinone oxidoreductase subunit 3 (subunit A)